MVQRKSVKLSSVCFGGIKRIGWGIRKSCVWGWGGCRGEPQWLEVTEDGHITVSLEDFLGIDENNLAVTLLFSKPARIGRLRLLAARSSLSLIRQMAAIAFALSDLWRFPNRAVSPGDAEISSQEMYKQCSKQKSSLTRVCLFFKSCRF